MCDNSNTTILVESECRFCGDAPACNEYRHSFAHRCQYVVIPGRFDEWGYQVGICTDGVDFTTLTMSPWVLIAGWALLLFVIGLDRKERGWYASLRRYGITLSARVTELVEPEESLVATAPSLPDVALARYYVRATWVLDPATYTLGNRCCRWRALLRHWKSFCRRRRGQPPPDSPWLHYEVQRDQGAIGAGFGRSGRRPLARTASNLTDTTDATSESGASDGSVIDYAALGVPPLEREEGSDEEGEGDGSLQRVEKKIQVTRSDWERVKKKHMVMRLTYDPLVGGSVLPASGVVGQPVSRVGLLFLGGGAGLSLIAMGTAMVIDAFHCGQHFWGWQACCNECSLWEDGASPASPQICYKGACDGLGGRTHMYWCESQCDVTWALIPLPSALAGILVAVAALQLRNGGAIKSDTRIGKACRFVCGEGKFCCPDRPPSIYEEDDEIFGQTETNEIVLGYHRLP